MRAVRAALLIALIAAAPAPGSDDAQTLAGQGDYIRRQVSPGGTSCCSEADGRPAEVRGVPGHYEVLFSREHWPDGNGQWLPVPAEAILPTPSPILVPIAWIYHGRVLCLALPAAA